MHGILFAGLRTSGTLQPEKSHHKKETMAVMEKDMTKGSPISADPGFYGSPDHRKCIAAAL